MVLTHCQLLQNGYGLKLMDTIQQTELSLLILNFPVKILSKVLSNNVDLNIGNTLLLDILGIIEQHLTHGVVLILQLQEKLPIATMELKKLPQLVLNLSQISQILLLEMDLLIGIKDASYIVLTFHYLDLINQFITLFIKLFENLNFYFIISKVILNFY